MSTERQAPATGSDRRAVVQVSGCCTPPTTPSRSPSPSPPSDPSSRPKAQRRPLPQPQPPLDRFRRKTVRNPSVPFLRSQPPHTSSRLPRRTSQLPLALRTSVLSKAGHQLPQGSLETRALRRANLRKGMRRQPSRGLGTGIARRKTSGLYTSGNPGLKMVERGARSRGMETRTRVPVPKGGLPSQGTRINQVRLGPEGRPRKEAANQPRSSRSLAPCSLPGKYDGHVFL